MPRICYRSHRFSAANLLMINQVNTIHADYLRQGFDLTLRQVYYQCVSRNWLPNTPESYDRLGALISDARLAGLIDWYAIVDRTRNLASGAHWDGPSAIIESAAAGFALDKWETQPYHVEVWVEKDALAGVVGHACRPLDVPYLACKGYMSQSEMWEAGQRILRKRDADKEVVIIHLGDHDPSGKDMTRDIMDRLTMFTYDTVNVKRIALNMDQIEQLNPPPNPAKITDSRATAYIAEFGVSSWELDAIAPDVLANLITETVLSFRDEAAWEAMEAEENGARKLLTTVSENWEAIAEYAQEQEW